MAYQVDFNAKNMRSFSLGLLVVLKLKTRGAKMAPDQVTTSFQSMGRIGLKVRL